MAGGNLSPRQKMVNLMYLVFIAMLAMNMSKEVLSAFGRVNEKLDKANHHAEKHNADFMKNLEQKVQEQEKVYKPVMENAQNIAKITDDFDDYIEELKGELLEGVEDVKDYETMDKSDRLDELFFKNGVISDKGNEFIGKIKEYREGVVSQIESIEGIEVDKSIENDIKESFNTDDVVGRDGATRPWLVHNFERFPQVASLTKFTQMQTDARNIENEILSSLLQGKQETILSFDNYEAIVVSEKTAYYPGERFKGKVVLGRFDDTMVPKSAKVNGKKQTKVKNGQVMLDFSVGGVGTKSIEGEIVFAEKGEDKTIPIKSTYSVIPLPDSDPPVVVSADKMNVVYRGVPNPITVSIPGIASVSASAPGLTRVSEGRYNLNPTTIKGRTVNIKVTGTLPKRPDGSRGKIINKSKKFRIKDIPRPVGTVRGEDGSLKMSRNGLEIASIGAKLQDFDFDVGIKVTGFKFKVSGQPTVIVNGSRLDSRAKSVLRRAKRGSSVQVFDIKARLANNSSYRLKKVSPVVIEITN